MKIIVIQQDKVNKLSTIFKNLKIFTDNLVIYLDEKKGLYIQGLDRTHCCMCEIKLVPEWFDTFEFDSSIDMPTIGINTIILQKIMNTYTEGQNIILSTIGESDKLDIEFLDKEKILDKHFKIPLMNIEIDILAITDDSKQVDLIMETKMFVDLVNQMQIFDDTLSLKFTENVIEISCDGDDCAMKVNVSLDDVTEYQIEEELTLEQKYSIQFIQMMCAFNKLSSEFVMKFDKDSPMEGKYVLGEDSYICFFVAPKMEDD
jgi:proliferating cell nuclear antigen PCNA